jgi:D-alanyl-D-alanine carboxypeptidase (penicillin-binding protein 5/6)
MRILLLIALLALPAKTVMSQGFETRAPIVVIIDQDTGTVLFEKNAREPMPPASMTKIMTLYVVFERLAAGALSLDDRFNVSDDAWRRGGFASGSSTMCLNPGESVRVEDLIKGVVVLSGNDAAITLAENISGSEAAFAKLMTERANELGLSSANFVNSTGWPAKGHEISAFDLAKLSQIMIDKFPKYYAYFTQKEYDWCKAAPSNRYNRNPLLSLFEGADGLKTGYTKEAGFGLVGSAIRDGQRRIVVTSGLQSRRDRSRVSYRLMSAAFREFSVTELFANNQPVGSVDIYLGTERSVKVRLANPITIGIFKPVARKVRAEIIYTGPVSAPVVAGQKLAVLRVYTPGQPAVDVDLVAMQGVTRKGFFGRFITGFVQLIQNTDD